MTHRYGHSVLADTNVSSTFHTSGSNAQHLVVRHARNQVSGRSGEGEKEEEGGKSFRYVHVDFEVCDPLLFMCNCFCANDGPPSSNDVSGVADVGSSRGGKSGGGGGYWRGRGRGYSRKQQYAIAKAQVNATDIDIEET